MKLIDVHHHIMPPAYMTGVGNERHFRQSGGRIPPLIAQWTPQRAIEAMDESGIGTAVTSISAPGTWFGNIDEGRRLSRVCNEYAAQLARDHKGRFGTFASLPLPDVEGSLAEIDYAFGTLKADGVVLMTSYDNRYPGEKEFAPVFEELNRRKAVVFFHPTAAPCCWNLITDVPDATIEFVFDTVRTVVSLLYSGALHRYPDIKFIFCHYGSAVPLMHTRFCSQFARDKALAERVPEGPVNLLKRLYFDTAGTTGNESLPPLLRLVGTDRILFGTDYPWGALSVKDTVQTLVQQGFSERDMRLVERDNALHLMPGLAL
jgi:predicted TIM-barrel fold metal-dependent hydrolase